MVKEMSPLTWGLCSRVAGDEPSCWVHRREARLGEWFHLQASPCSPPGMGRAVAAQGLREQEGHRVRYDTANLLGRGFGVHRPRPPRHQKELGVRGPRLGEVSPRVTQHPKGKGSDLDTGLNDGGS